MLTAIKESHQRYYSTAYSRSGVDQMWILKNSKELLENLKSNCFSKIDSLKTSDFSTLYTTISHSKLKSTLFQILDNRCIFCETPHNRFSGNSVAYLIFDHGGRKTEYKTSHGVSTESTHTSTLKQTLRVSLAFLWTISM
jgi:hypothetical protein